MTNPKRKSQYKTNYASDFKGIRKGKDDYHAHCIPCNDEINLMSMGKTAIAQHQDKKKHMENAKAADTTRFILFLMLLLLVSFRALSNFVPSRSAPTATDEKTAAAEGTWAFHLAIHNQPFASSDCCSSDALFRTMFSDSDIAKKFGCGRNKVKAILTGLFIFLFCYSVFTNV